MESPNAPKRHSCSGTTILILTVVGTIATVASCAIAFVALVNQMGTDRFTIPSYQSEPPTPRRAVSVVAIPTVPVHKTSIPSVPTPTLVSSLFEDNFDIGAHPEWQPVQGTWRMVDGAYGIDESDNRWAYVMVGDLGWQDYVVQVDVALRCYGANPKIAVLLRSKDQRDGMQFLADPYRIRWNLYRGGQSKEIGMSDRGIPYDSNCMGSLVKSHLRFEVKGSVYTAYLNDTLVSRVQDGTFATGRVGLGTPASTNYVRFDNFIVSSLR